MTEEHQTVIPHHCGILGVRKMRHLHSCPQCFEPEEVELFIVNVAVMWKRVSDLHIACCRKCLEKLQDCAIGQIV